MEDNPRLDGKKVGYLASVTLNGTLWSYASFFCGKLLVFISTVILARLLTDDDFGVMSFALVVMSFLDILSDFGVGQAVIYQKDDPDTQNTAFWLGIAISLTLFTITWFAAPLAGLYFKDARATLATRALALTFPIDALGNIHNMLLRKRFSFGKKFIPEFIKAFSKGSASIILALLGYGFWSLVIGQIVGAIAAVIAFWCVLPWRPSFRFKTETARNLLQYGGSLVGGNFFSIINSNVDYLLIGRFMSAAALGVYTLAFRIPDLVINQFCNVISQVVFPVFVKLQDDSDTLRNGFLTTVRYMSIITVPLGIGLAIVAKPAVLVLFTDKWIQAVPVLRAISIYSMLLSLGYSAGIVYKAQGRPNILSVIGFFNVLITVPTLSFVVFKIGTIESVGYAQACIACLFTIIELNIACKMLNVPMLKILHSFSPALLSGSVMGLAVWGALVLLEDTQPLIQLITGTAVGGAVYFGVLWIFQRKVLTLMGQTLKMTIARSRA